jgi:hypothetical protein
MKGSESAILAFHDINCWLYHLAPSLAKAFLHTLCKDRFKEVLGSGVTVTSFDWFQMAIIPLYHSAPGQEKYFLCVLC